MPALDVRHRSGYLFVVVVVAQIIIISAQVGTRSGAPALEVVVLGAFSEVQRVGSAVVRGVREAWTGYVDLRGVRAENEVLQRQLRDTQIALQQERALAQRTRGLQRLLELREKVAVATTAADVIGAAATPDFRTITIDKGTAAGLRSDMAVIAPAGVVGRIVVPSARASKVQLLIDRNAAAGALIERTRAQGVVLGTGEGYLELDYLSGTVDIVPGDTVVTSGIDGIFPKGFVIGWVDQVERAGTTYKRVTVRPAVDYSSLEEVLVVLTPPVALPNGPAEARR
ncbi:MAG TPA: rod shape-determining protein MreC [Vicinamibacterales bacterium]|nr:rod shape-determining protein MreC [Vicinamibacterales bacterium]